MHLVKDLHWNTLEVEWLKNQSQQFKNPEELEGPEGCGAMAALPQGHWRCRTVKPLRTRAWRFLIKSDMGVGTIIPPRGISSGARKTCVHIKICTQPFRGDEFTTPKSENLRFHDDSMVKALRFQSKGRGFGPRKLRTFMPCSSTNTHTHTHTHTHKPGTTQMSMFTNWMDNQNFRSPIWWNSNKQKEPLLQAVSLVDLKNFAIYEKPDTKDYIFYLYVFLERQIHRPRNQVSDG